MDSGGKNNISNVQLRNLPVAIPGIHYTNILVDKNGSLYQSVDITTVTKSNEESKLISNQPATIPRTQKIFHTPQNRVNYDTDDSNAFMHNDWASNS